MLSSPHYNKYYLLTYLYSWIMCISGYTHFQFCMDKDSPVGIGRVNKRGNNFALDLKKACV